MIRWIFRVLFYTWFFFFFSSCEVFDPQEQVPSYIYIEKIDLTTAYLTQGSESSKFSDAWVYIDDQPVGVYELPATIPVLGKGAHQLKVRGGIKVNGISALRSAYPLCNFYQQNIDLKVNDKISLAPEVNYFSSIQFKWIEDFENVGFSLSKTSASDTSIQATSDIDKIFEGENSGAVYLDSIHSFFECKSSVSYNLPFENVFLELNYKSNNTFVAGIYSASNIPYTTLYINPSVEWNKIYINLANEIAYANAGPYYIFIAMTKSSDVEFPELYLDNIKLIHQ